MACTFDERIESEGSGGSLGMQMAKEQSFGCSLLGTLAKKSRAAGSAVLRSIKDRSVSLIDYGVMDGHMLKTFTASSFTDDSRECNGNISG
jgi:Leu/Phe-tRNA-protein transferase